MKLKTTIILTLGLCLNNLLSAQTVPKTCSTDTFQLILAYESGGQFILDDMIFKSNEFIIYDGSEITLKTYGNGVFQLPHSINTDWLKIKDCNPKYNFDSLINIDASYPFDTLKTKELTKINETFKGIGKDRFGQKVELPAIAFKYKLFKVTFIATFMGNGSRSIVNMDRKSKSEKEWVTIDCPVYFITQFLDIKTQ